MRDAAAGALEALEYGIVGTNEGMDARAAAQP
jgi:hypothetical protein